MESWGSDLLPATSLAPFLLPLFQSHEVCSSSAERSSQVQGETGILQVCPSPSCRLQPLPTVTWCGHRCGVVEKAFHFPNKNPFCQQHTGGVFLGFVGLVGFVLLFVWFGFCFFLRWAFGFGFVELLKTEPKAWCILGKPLSWNHTPGLEKQTLTNITRCFFHCSVSLRSHQLPGVPTASSLRYSHPEPSDMF